MAATITTKFVGLQLNFRHGVVLFLDFTDSVKAQGVVGSLMLTGMPRKICPVPSQFSQSTP